MGDACLKLRFGDRELWLMPGTYDIGRSQSCHLRIDDTRVSRLHAQLIVRSAAEALVRDCDSVNGVFVDGRRIGRNPAKLAPGSRITIGKEVILVKPPLSLPQSAPAEPLDEDRMTDPGGTFPSHAAVAPGAAGAPGGVATVRTAETQRTDALELYVPVARAAIAAGRATDAEALMGAHLRGVLARLRTEGDVHEDSVQRAIAMALDLARARRPGWFEFVLDVYEVLRVVPPADVITGLESALEVHPEIDVWRFGRWVQSVRGRVQELRPEHLPALDRLEVMVGAAIRARG